MYLTEGQAIATKHRVATPPKERIRGSARTSAVFFHVPNYDCSLRPVLPATVDPTLGQGRREFDLDALRDPDDSIPYWRLLQREAELGFKKQGCVLFRQQHRLRKGALSARGSLLQRRS